MTHLRKRLFDVVVASVLAVAALPIVVVSAVALAVSLRAWPFFVQDRVGRDGRRFRFLKLRTLPPSAPAYADKYRINDEVTIPRLARILRAKHLDELPQLLLVILGRMTLVGPRPEMPHMHAEADPAIAGARVSVRPGCAGLWQASVDQNRLIWETPEYDLFYLRHASIRLDLWILWRTALMMLHLAKPVSLHDVPRWAIGAGLVPADALPLPSMRRRAASEFVALPLVPEMPAAVAQSA